MLANFFGKFNPVNFIIIFLIFLSFFFATLFSSFSFEEFLEQGIVKHLSTMGLYILLFVLFNFILAKNKLTLYNSYGFLFFTLLFGIFPFVILDQYELLVNVILLFFLRKVYSLKSPKATFKKMFDSGFWLSVLFTLNPFVLVYGILLYISISLFQKLNFRTVLIPIIGFFVPLLCYFTYCFWYDDTKRFVNLFSWFTDYNFDFYTDMKIYISLLFVGAIVLVSIIFKTPKAFLISSNYRKLWSLTILNFLIALCFVTLTKNRTGAELMCVFFPTAIILTNWVERVSKKIVQNLILTLFVLAPIILFII